MSRTAFLFPGQGSQTPDSAPLARKAVPGLFDLAIGLLGEDPFPRCSESTRFAQPAIVLASLAAWSGQDPEPSEVAAFAGHSLGELSALAASGALAHEDAVRLAVVRGELMAQAAERAGDGAMLAVLKGGLADAERLAADHDLTVANDNAPGQVVLAGPRAGIETARRGARELGLRAMELDVAGAFHSPSMETARIAFADELAQVTWHEPAAPVYSSLTAAPFVEPARELATAIVSPVRWREVMLALAADGIERFVDLGPGEVLARLVNRNLEGARDVVAASA